PRYGVPKAFRDPFIIRCRARALFEFPLATVQIMNQRLPVAGGGDFRLLPYAVTPSALRLINRTGSLATVYMHPYEPDTREFRSIEGPGSRALGLSQGMGRRWICDRLTRLLADFSWAPARSLLQDESIFAGRHVDIGDLSDRPRWSDNS